MFTGKTKNIANDQFVYPAPEVFELLVFIGVIRDGHFSNRNIVLLYLLFLAWRLFMYR